MNAELPGLACRLVADSGATVPEVEKGKNLPALAALRALKKIRNPEVVPILAKELTHADLEDVVFIASGDALAAMGRPEATKALLEWHPTILHDLHEAQSYLYVSTGTGPYNVSLDPIASQEWWLLGQTEVPPWNAEPP